jgi:hypothetical protein
VGSREWWAAAIIGACIAAITGSEGGGNYGRLKRGELMEGLPLGAAWCRRRRGSVHGAAARGGGGARPAR